MIEITLQEGDRLEWALKSFKRQVLRSGLFQELRRRREPPPPPNEPAQAVDGAFTLRICSRSQR
jgi:ribosomal protein S21